MKLMRARNVETLGDKRYYVLESCTAIVRDGKVFVGEYKRLLQPNETIRFKELEDELVEIEDDNFDFGGRDFNIATINLLKQWTRINECDLGGQVLLKVGTDYERTLLIFENKQYYGVYHKTDDDGYRPIYLLEYNDIKWLITKEERLQVLEAEEKKQAKKRKELYVQLKEEFE